MIKILICSLELLREAFPEAFIELPKNMYDAGKLMKDLGIGYKKYDAFPIALYTRGISEIGKNAGNAN